MSPLFLAAALAAVPAPVATPAPPPTPSEIVAAAPAGAWKAIPANDVLIMTLAPDAAGHARQVVIQLIPAPYSRAWTANIRALAKAHWWDGLAIVRSQDNYVVQWGDPDAEDAAKSRPLPTGLIATSEKDYTVTTSPELSHAALGVMGRKMLRPASTTAGWQAPVLGRDGYANYATFASGFPIAGVEYPDAGWNWPVHCYGTVGVGRGLSPDAGTGAELYTVIGQAPRHLDRNIAVVGRVIEGIEHLSTLRRGTEALGFYATPEERTPIVSVRLASELPAADQPQFEFLSTESPAFADYVTARASRKDDFFIVPADGIDVCNAPVPVRRIAAPK